MKRHKDGQSQLELFPDESRPPRRSAERRRTAAWTPFMNKHREPGAAVAGRWCTSLANSGATGRLSINGEQELLAEPNRNAAARKAVTATGLPSSRQCCFASISNQTTPNSPLFFAPANRSDICAACPGLEGTPVSVTSVGFRANM